MHPELEVVAKKGQIWVYSNAPPTFLLLSATLQQGHKKLKWKEKW